MSENTPDSVEDFLIQFLGDDPKSPDFIRNKASKLLDQDPRSAEALTGRAWANYELDDYEEAIRDATKAIELCPDAYLPWHIRGASYWQSGKPAKAEPDLSEAIRLSQNVELFLDEAYRYRGGIRCNDNRTVEAIDDLNRCIKIDPDDAWAYVFRGNAFYLDKKYRNAKRDYEFAVGLDEDDPYPAATFAWCLAVCPDDEIRDGVRSLELAKRANDLSDGAYQADLAVAYAESGDFKAAVKAQTQAIKHCEDKSEKKDLLQRLRLFESNQPYREAGGDK